MTTRPTAPLSDTTPNLSEVLVDAWVARAVKNYGKSETALKKYCLIAAPVVGKYILGGTKAIADGIQRDISTVENHAHAVWLYQDLRSNGSRKLAWQLFRSLPTSHWWLAYEIKKAGYDALVYLRKADQHRWSGRRMLEEYRKDRDAGQAPLIFKHGVHALRGLVNELLNTYNRQLTEDQRIALLGVVDAFPSAGMEE